MFSDEKIQLNPPKVLHDSPPDVILAIEIDMLKISCRDYASGEVRTWGIPADQCHYAPDLLTMLMRVYPAQPLSKELFLSIIASLIYVMKSLSRSDQEHSPQNSVEQLVNFLRQHYFNQELSLEGIAEIFNLSPQYMNRILQKSGLPSIHALLKDIRLEEAARLLASGEYKVKDVARLTGWRSAAYFRSCFVQKFHMTPQAYLNRSETGNCNSIRKG
jgi:AraC-like DNA-binding protein